MIRCQVCGYDNKDDAELCLNCGETLVKAKVSQAMDDVSDEATVLIDPAAMQKRIQDEIKKEKPAAPPAPAGAPARPAVPAAAPPPPRAAAPAPAVASAPAGDGSERGEKQWVVALVLAFFIPGGHRFYLGKIGSGVLQFVTLGGCGIWQLIDFIMIATDKFTDAEGKLLKK